MTIEKTNKQTKKKEQESAVDNFLLRRYFVAEEEVRTSTCLA